MRLLSYNIREGGAGRDALIADVVRSTDADVVALQEATIPAVVHRVAHLARYEHVATAAGLSAACLSRLPIARSRWHRPRGSRHAFLEVQPEAFPSLYCLHLNAWFSRWSEQRRTREIRAILAAIPHDAGDHLIAGDFNAVEPDVSLEIGRFPRWIRAMLWMSGRDIGRDTIRAMQDAGYHDAWRSRHPLDPGYTFPTWDPHVRLDYVFASARLGERVTRSEVVQHEAAARASDHLPLLVEIE